MEGFIHHPSGSFGSFAVVASGGGDTTAGSVGENRMAAVSGWEEYALLLVLVLLGSLMLFTAGVL
jgi:hypothetical protein